MHGLQLQVEIRKLPTNFEGDHRNPSTTPGALEVLNVAVSFLEIQFSPGKHCTKLLFLIYFPCNLQGKICLYSSTDQQTKKSNYHNCTQDIYESNF